MWRQKDYNIALKVHSDEGLLAETSNIFNERPTEHGQLYIL